MRIGLNCGLGCFTSTLGLVAALRVVRDLTEGLFGAWWAICCCVCCCEVFFCCWGIIILGLFGPKLGLVAMSLLDTVLRPRTLSPAVGCCVSAGQHPALLLWLPLLLLLFLVIVSGGRFAPPAVLLSPTLATSTTRHELQSFKCLLKTTGGGNARLLLLSNGQLASSTLTNFFSLSRYWLYSSTSL